MNELYLIVRQMHIQFQDQMCIIQLNQINQSKLYFTYNPYGIDFFQAFFKVKIVQHIKITINSLKLFSIIQIIQKKKIMNFIKYKEDDQNSQNSSQTHSLDLNQNLEILKNEKQIIEQRKYIQLKQINENQNIHEESSFEIIQIIPNNKNKQIFHKINTENQIKPSKKEQNKSLYQNEQHILQKNIKSIKQVDNKIESKQKINKNQTKLIQIQQKVKVKHRAKRFDSQNSNLFQKLEKFKQRQSSLSTPKIKFKMGSGQFPPQQSLLITTWNVNGIRFCVSKNHLSYYINHTKPDILCLTQTKMDQYSQTKQPIDIFGYNGYWNFCKCSSGYSGVVVFSKFQPIRIIEGIRENIQLDSLDQQKQLGEDFDKEGRVLTLQFKDFYLVTVYVPASGKKLQRLQYKCKQFEPRLFAFCQKLMKKKRTIIAGDMNTALSQLDTHLTKNTKRGPAFTITQRQSLQGFINKNNLIDAYRYKNPTKKQFTWWHIKYFGREYLIGKRLDYFLLTQNMKQAINSCEIKQKFKGSDHSPVEIKLNLKHILMKKQ